MAKLQKAEASASATPGEYEPNNYVETKTGVPVKAPQQGFKTKPKAKAVKKLAE